MPVGTELLEQLKSFDCVPDDDLEDVIAHEVNEFLRDGEYELGFELGINTTYLLMEDDTSELLGYLSLGMDVVKLSGGERDRIMPGSPKPTFGAVRVVMIGVGNDYVNQGLGSALIDAAIGIARRTAKEVALRFLTADVNVKKQEWYENRGFDVNRSPDEANRGGEHTVSMRFDLKRSDELHGSS